jgi:hypothetical protein
MTAGRYDLDANPKRDVLDSEKQEIIASLTRIKTEEVSSVGVTNESSSAPVCLGTSNRTRE